MTRAKRKQQAADAPAPAPKRRTRGATRDEANEATPKVPRGSSHKAGASKGTSHRKRSSRSNSAGDTTPPPPEETAVAAEVPAVQLAPPEPPQPPQPPPPPQQQPPPPQLAPSLTRPVALAPPPIAAQYPQAAMARGVARPPAAYGAAVQAAAAAAAAFAPALSAGPRVVASTAQRPPEGPQRQRRPKQQPQQQALEVVVPVQAGLSARPRGVPGGVQVVVGQPQPQAQAQAARAQAQRRRRTAAELAAQGVPAQAIVAQATMVPPPQAVIGGSKAVVVDKEEKDAAYRAAVQAFNAQMKTLRARWQSALARLKQSSRRGYRGGLLPTMCLPTRAKTQLDFALDEARWLAVDFHEERKWKIAVAKKLAEACAARILAPGAASRSRDEEYALARRADALLDAGRPAVWAGSRATDLAAFAVARFERVHVVTDDSRRKQWSRALERRGVGPARLVRDAAASDAYIVDARGLASFPSLDGAKPRVVVVPECLGDEENGLRRALGLGDADLASILVTGAPPKQPSRRLRPRDEEPRRKKHRAPLAYVVRLAATEAERRAYARVAARERRALSRARCADSDKVARPAAAALRSLALACADAKVGFVADLLRHLAAAGKKAVVAAFLPEALRRLRRALKTAAIAFVDLDDATNPRDDATALLVSSRRLLAPLDLAVDAFLVLDADPLRRLALLDRCRLKPDAFALRLVVDATLDAALACGVPPEPPPPAEPPAAADAAGDDGAPAEENAAAPVEEEEEEDDEGRAASSSSSSSSKGGGGVANRDDEQPRDVVEVSRLPRVIAVEKEPRGTGPPIANVANAPIDLVLLAEPRRTNELLLPCAPAKRDRLARRLSRATCRFEAAHLATVEAATQKDQSRWFDEGFFYEAVLVGGPGGIAAPLAGDPTLDLSAARPPLGDVHDLVHSPEWLRVSRQTTLNRRLKYNAQTAAAATTRRIAAAKKSATLLKTAGATKSMVVLPTQAGPCAHPQTRHAQQQQQQQPQQQPPAATIPVPPSVPRHLAPPAPAPAAKPDEEPVEPFDPDSVSFDDVKKASPGLVAAWGTTERSWQRRGPPPIKRPTRPLDARSFVAFLAKHAGPHPKYVAPVTDNKTFLVRRDQDYETRATGEGEDSPKDGKPLPTPEETLRRNLEILVSCVKENPPTPSPFDDEDVEDVEDVKKEPPPVTDINRLFEERNILNPFQIIDRYEAQKAVDEVHREAASAAAAAAKRALDERRAEERETPTEAAPAAKEAPTEAAPAAKETSTEASPAAKETPTEAAPAAKERETPTEAAPAPSSGQQHKQEDAGPPHQQSGSSSSSSSSSSS